MKPTIWVSPDTRHIVVLDKVAAVRPECGRGHVMVLLRGGRLLLDAANAKHLKAALLRFHNINPTEPTQTEKQS